MIAEPGEISAPGKAVKSHEILQVSQDEQHGWGL